MGYHPETLAFSFPPYPRRGDGRWSLYRLRDWIGFDIWHIDPEKRCEGQRTDDSCGWFDRRPGPYQAALARFMGDVSDMHDLRLTMARQKHVPMAHYEGISKPRTDVDRAPGYPRLSQADTLAAVLHVASALEIYRHHAVWYPAPWWKRPFIRRRSVFDLAVNLSLNSVGNLSSVETPERMVAMIAGAMHREWRAWWRHPRWHIHHWKVNINLVRNLRRATVERCGTCRRPIGFGKSPIDPGDGTHHHHECLGIGLAVRS